MNHHVYRILIALTLILLIGAGCSNNDTQTQQEPTATPEQQAYAKCVQAGYTPDLVTDDSGQKFFCILPDNTECSVNEILDDTCFKEFADAEKERQRRSDTDEATPRVCDPVAEPVCGEDGRTYTNTCIAEQYDIPIAHEGACTPEEQTTPPATDPTIPTLPTTGDPSEETPLPDWFHIAYNLTKEQTTSPVQAYECNVNTNLYYLLKPVSCETCFNTLYRTDGTIACHTNHDVGRTCPRDTLKQNPPSPCRLLFTR